jgi:PRC-barrel domain
VPHIGLASFSISQFAHISAYGQICSAAAKAILRLRQAAPIVPRPVLREALHTRAASAGVGCKCFDQAFRPVGAIRPAAKRPPVTLRFAVARRWLRCNRPSSSRAPARVRFAQERMEAMMQTDATSWELHNLIASDRVEGTQVRSTDGAPIGTIERVMIDKLTGNIAYAVMRLEEPVGVAQEDLSVPWPRLPYDPKLAAYRLDLINGELGEVPSFAANKDFDRGGRERYWGIAETW